MWNPTHVQVTGVNDTYVTIQLSKEKYQTSVQEKTLLPEWHEECELTIPDGNSSAIILTVFHRNFVGLDRFLGRVDVPLQELDIYDRPRNKLCLIFFRNDVPCIATSFLKKMRQSGSRNLPEQQGLVFSGICHLSMIYIIIDVVIAIACTAFSVVLLHL